ncbi:MAG: dicarboxylate/amino acid:cation symporter [Planctomycetota bacterium]|nr:MAG: dicarboxylate/amino acid:cation symporter [Planctomycetota bacterium]
MGMTVAEDPEGQVVVVDQVRPGGPADKAGLRPGQRLAEVTLSRGHPERERTLLLRSLSAYEEALSASAVGEVLWVRPSARAESLPVSVGMDPGSERVSALAPFVFVADIFLALLKMLIVPIILTSIITGITGVGSGKDLRRLSLKTFAYYISTSLIAAGTGLVLVNLIRPGDGASLGLPAVDAFDKVAGQNMWDVLRRMVPSNVFEAFSDNGQMLQVIFFALLFGVFVLRAAEPHRGRMQAFFESAFEVMMGVASFVLSLIPYGVFALIVKVVGQTGFGLFKPLGLYMLTVLAALAVHSLVTLPILLRVVGRVNPLRWAHAMGPALMTAFSTSSSSMTLPVNLKTVEQRGKISNKTTSFVLPLGATINMDGTALYECIGVIFLAQYYTGVSGFELTWGVQIQVVFMALLASVGAAGIPSAGLVMMLTILGALGLPVEGAALLLAVDRPLDMLRTVVNVWSDGSGAAIVARTEGEVPLGPDPAPASSS